MATTLELDVRNPSGIHARPGATFVRAAAKFRSDVRVANASTDSAEVSAKSLISVIGLGIRQGHRIRLTIDGEDEADAATGLRELVESGLGEELPED